MGFHHHEAARRQVGETVAAINGRGRSREHGTIGRVAITIRIRVECDSHSFDSGISGVIVVGICEYRSGDRSRRVAAVEEVDIGDVGSRDDHRNRVRAIGRITIRVSDACGTAGIGFGNDVGSGRETGECVVAVRVGDGRGDRAECDFIRAEPTVAVEISIDRHGDEGHRSIAAAEGRGGIGIVEDGAADRVENHTAVEEVVADTRFAGAQDDADLVVGVGTREFRNVGPVVDRGGAGWVVFDHHIAGAGKVAERVGTVAGGDGGGDQRLAGDLACIIGIHGTTAIEVKLAITHEDAVKEPVVGCGDRAITVDINLAIDDGIAENRAVVSHIDSTAVEIDQTADDIIEWYQMIAVGVEIETNEDARNRAIGASEAVEVIIIINRAGNAGRIGVGVGVEEAIVAHRGICPRDRDDRGGICSLGLDIILRERGQELRVADYHSRAGGAWCHGGCPVAVGVRRHREDASG